MVTKAFVQEFVVTYLDEIRLKKDENRFGCPSCNGLQNGKKMFIKGNLYRTLSV